MSAPPRFDDADVDAARRVLALAKENAGEPVAVVTLTDEEIVILDGLQHDQVVALPWLSEQTEREVAGAVALRSLIARGLVRAVDPEPGSDDDVALVAVPEITGPLVLRRTADRLVVAHRTTSLGESWWYGYRHDEVLLEEDVVASGHHTFGVYSTGHAVERLLPFVDPESRAGSPTTPRRVDRDALPDAVAAPPFADATAVTTLTSVDVGTSLAVVVSVYAGPSGVTVLTGAADDDAVVATGVDRTGLAAVLEEAVGRG